MVSTDDDILEQTLTVIYDDKKTDIEAIKNALRKAGYPVEEEHRYIK